VGNRDRRGLLVSNAQVVERQKSGADSRRFVSFGLVWFRLVRTRVESIGTDLMIQKDFSDYLLSKQSLLRIMIAFSSSLPSNASFNRTNF